MKFSAALCPTDTDKMCILPILMTYSSVACQPCGQQSQSYMTYFYIPDF